MGPDQRLTWSRSNLHLPKEKTQGKDPQRRLILFDIDNTLISIGSGNLPQWRAMNRAFVEVHGVPDAFDHVPFTGGMDLPLMVEVYRTWGFMPEESGTLPNMSGFKAAYFDHLVRNLEDWTGGEVCPGVPDLLEALSSDGRVQLGLETGNFREAAFIKLRRYGLHSYFREGGFGGDHMQKRDVVAAAIERCQEASGVVFQSGEMVLVGDTRSDIEAGAANGIQTIAVATGAYSRENLRDCHPTHNLPDLSDTEEVLNLIFGGERPQVTLDSGEGAQPA